MKWLLWREYRLNRLILVTGAVLLLLPYLGAVIVLCWVPEPLVIGGPPICNAMVASGFASIYSIVLSQLTLALLGGNAFAGERADRSAEFMAYLPLSRRKRLVGKLSLSLSTAVLIWGVNLLVLLLLLCTAAPSLPPKTGAHWGEFGYYVAITGLLFFGVGWLVSSLQSSPTFAVCAGMITPFLVVNILAATAWVYDIASLQPITEIGYAVTCPVLAVACFSIGTWYYLHRVEP